MSDSDFSPEFGSPFQVVLEHCEAAGINFRANAKQKAAFFSIRRDAGRRLQQGESVPWIVLDHEPPGGTPLSATDEVPAADFARKLIEVAEPDFSLRGHVHQAATAGGGSWIWPFGKTVSFNTGQSGPGEALHYVLLEWRGRDDWTPTWKGVGRTLRAESSKKRFL